MSVLPIYPRWASSALNLSNSSYVQIQVQNPAVLDSLSIFTLEAWVNLSSGESVTVFDKSTYVSGVKKTAFTVTVSPDSISFSSGSQGVGRSLLNISENEWHHVAVSYDGTTITLYLDCELVSHGPFTLGNYGTDLLNTPVWIGATRNSQNQPSAFFNGSIGMAMIWGICRSGGEIMSDANNHGTQFYHIADLSSTDPSTDPTYELQQVNPLVGFDFSIPPSADVSGLGNSFIYVSADGSYSYEPSYLLSVPAATFNGVGNYISAGNLPQFHISQDSSFTIDGWFSTNKTGSKQTIISLGHGTQEYQVTLLEDNTLYISRGSDYLGSVAALNTNTYYHFAISYNYIATNPSMSTLSLFINGNLRSTIFANSPIQTQNAGLLIGAANNANGQTYQYFSGSIQTINFWSVAHDEAQVRQWMYNQIVYDESVVAAFDLSVNPPIDTCNETPLQNFSGFGTYTQFTNPGELPFGTPMPINATYLYQKEIEFKNEVPAQLNIAPQPDVFSAEHKEAIWNGVKNWAGPFISEADFKQKFETAFEQAKQIMDKDPRLKKVVSRVDKDGITKLIYHGRHRDQVILSTTTGILSDCTLWWIGFVAAITIGFFEAIGLFPSIEGVASKVYTKVVSNSTARNALITLTKETITVSSAIDFMGVLVSTNIIWGIMKLILSMLGWWALTKLLATVIGIITGLEAAALLAGFIVWAAQLIILVLDYPNSCGNSQPNPPQKV